MTRTPLPIFKSIKDLGVLIGSVSVPFGDEREFYENFIKVLFQNYKNAVSENFREKTDQSEEFKKLCYIPKVYVTFGDFDMAILSYVDSVEFAIRTFQPFDPNAGDKYEKGFSYRVSQSLIPNTQNNDKKNLFDSNQFAFISICQLKINSALLIPKTIDQLYSIIYYVEKFIDDFFENKQKPEIKLQYTILISQSWNEISIILHSNSINFLLELTLAVRELEIQKLEGLYKKSNNQKISEQESLLKYLIDKQNSKKGQSFNINNSHLFEFTRTTIGCDIDIWLAFENGSNELTKEFIDEEVFYFTEWKCKSGHINSAVKSLKMLNGDAMLFPGKNDFLYPSKFKKIKISEFLEFHSKLLSKKVENGIENHIQSCKTTFSIRPDKQYGDDVKPQHYYFRRKNINFLSLKQAKINQLHNELRKLQVSKILTTRIINIIGNFNQSLNDPYLTNIMIDLASYIERLLDIKNLEKQSRELSLVLFEKILNINIEFLEKAWRNRFSSNAQLIDLYDFNTDFKTGIQQTLTAIDGTYKILCQEINGKDFPFACIGTDAEIKGTEISIILNLFHVFQPAFFLAAAGHEAGHSFLNEYRNNPLAQRYTENNHLASENILNDISQFVFMQKDHEILSFFNTDLFDDIVADLCSFYFVFAGQEENFIFWHLGHFYTSRLSIDKINKGKIKISFPAMYNTLFRIILVLNAAGSKFDYINHISQWQDKNILNKIDSSQKNIFSIKIFKNWLKEINNLVYSKFEKSFQNIDSKFSFNNKAELFDEIENKSEKYLKRFNNGEIPDMNNGEHTSYQNICLLSNAYLQLIRKKAGKGKYLLKRDETGSPIIDNTNAKIMFDSRGGFFIADPTVRREIFQYRATLSLCLWDASNKFKYGRMKNLYSNR